MLPDEVVMKAFPLLAVPGSGRVPPAEGFGTRYLVARSGLYREVCLPWLHATLPLGSGTWSATPYGDLAPGIKMLFGKLPMQLVQEFKAVAIAALPNETTAVLAWNCNSGAWRLVPRTVTHASRAQVVYGEAQLEDGEHLVVDIHSHGALPAYFSAEDDKDDRGAMKIAAVIGEVDTATPKMKARLVLPDCFLPLMLSPDGSMGYGEPQ